MQTCVRILFSQVLTNRSLHHPFTQRCNAHHTHHTHTHTHTCTHARTHARTHKAAAFVTGVVQDWESTTPIAQQVAYGQAVTNQLPAQLLEQSANLCVLQDTQSRACACLGANRTIVAVCTCACLGANSTIVAVCTRACLGANRTIADMRIVDSMIQHAPSVHCLFVCLMSICLRFSNITTRCSAYSMIAVV